MKEVKGSLLLTPKPTIPCPSHLPSLQSSCFLIAFPIKLLNSFLLPHPNYKSSPSLCNFPTNMRSTVWIIKFFCFSLNLSCVRGHAKILWTFLWGVHNIILLFFMSVSLASLMAVKHHHMWKLKLVIGYHTFHDTFEAFIFKSLTYIEVIWVDQIKYKWVNKCTLGWNSF